LLFASHWPWAVGLTVGTAALITPGLSFVPPRYELGGIAPVDIRAPYDFSYEDRSTTDARREQAAAQLPEVYDLNPRAADAALSRLSAAFELGRGALERKGKEREEGLAASRSALGVPALENEFAVLIREEFRPALEQALGEALITVLRRDIVASKERMAATGVIARRTGPSTSVLTRDFSSILTLDEARRELADQIALQTDLSSGSRLRLTALASRFVEPTLTFNFAETERRRAEARARVEPVYFQMKEGRTVVRAGDPIDEGVLRQLERLRELEGRRWGLAGVLGAVLVASFLFLCLWHLIRPLQRGSESKRRSFSLVGLTILLNLAMAKFIFFVAGAVGDQIVTPPFNNVRSYYYAIPFASVAVLVALLETGSTALLASVVFSLAIGFMTGDLYLAAMSFLSCLGAILAAFQYMQRTAVIKAGLLIGSINFFLVLAIDLLADRYQPWMSFGFDLLCGFLGGAAVTVVVGFLLPALETLFERTTDIRLLELSNQNISLLRRLALEAPGTYHHSVVVGSLSEAAAETIGANAILCRTAALYHDIGKLHKVDYFIENQFAGLNRHDKLSPRMSALIIASHVKEGIEMAKQANLPPAIIDIIPQHHGTKLITYFYEKARQSEDPALGEVREEEFRYPGPKPQTKEAAIVMIADAVEAASRTLEEPSPARLRGVIRKIIDYIFLDGQLDECDLTLRDLEKISQSFQRVLMGIHHHRVSYPGFDFEKLGEPVVVQNGR
jgi:hypothetical protein